MAGRRNQTAPWPVKGCAGRPCAAGPARTSTGTGGRGAHQARAPPGTAGPAPGGQAGPADSPGVGGAAKPGRPGMPPERKGVAMRTLGKPGSAARRAALGGSAAGLMAGLAACGLAACGTAVAGAGTAASGTRRSP